MVAVAADAMSGPYNSVSIDHEDLTYVGENTQVRPFGGSTLGALSEKNKNDHPPRKIASACRTDVDAFIALELGSTVTVLPDSMSMIMRAVLL